MQLNSFFLKGLTFAVLITGSQIVHAQNGAGSSTVASNTFSKKLTILPSLTSGMFNVVINSPNASIPLTVSDHKNTVIFQTVLSEYIYSLDLSEKPVGQYFVTIKLGDETITKSLILK